MSSHNICFCGEIRKKLSRFLSNWTYTCIIYANMSVVNRVFEFIGCVKHELVFGSKQL